MALFPLDELAFINKCFSSTMDMTKVFPQSPRATCAVCDINGLYGGRSDLVDTIAALARLSGSFSVPGVHKFWSKFTKRLCNSCINKLEVIENKRKQALSLLEEAVQLDPGNDVVRKNRDALKSMV